MQNSDDTVFLDGRTLGIPTYAPLYWFASQSEHLTKRISRTALLSLAMPVAWSRQLLVGGTTCAPAGWHRIGWSLLRGLQEDRLVELGREFARRFLVPRAEQALQLALPQVQLNRVQLNTRNNAVAHGKMETDFVQFVAEPLAQALGFSDLRCNQLEVRHGKCTGRLLDPIIAPARREAPERTHLRLLRPAGGA